MGLISEALFEGEQNRTEEAKTQAFKEGFNKGFEEARRQILSILRGNNDYLWREINQLGEDENG